MNQNILATHHTFRSLNLFNSDPLWDGEQCEGTCCSGTKPPPAAHQHTVTDRIEVGVFIRWNGTVEWNGGMEQWNGIVEWNGGIVKMTTLIERIL